MKKKSGWVRVSFVCSLFGSLALLALTLPPLLAQEETPPPKAEPAVAPAPAETVPAAVTEPAAEAVPAETKPAAEAVPAPEATPAVEPAVPVKEGGTEVAPAPVEAQVDVQPEEIDASEKVRREELYLMAEQYVRDASIAWRGDKYRDALDLYKKAEVQLTQAGKSRRVLDELARIKRNMTEVNVDWAESLAVEAENFADTNKFDDAVDKCRQAAELDPSRRQKMDRMIRAYQAHKKTAEFRQDIAEVNIDKDKVERERAISVLLEQGKVFYRNRRYADARDYFEQMLVKDPYDVRAIRYLRQIDREQIRIGAEKRITTFAERLAEIRWKWNDAVTPLLTGSGVGMGGTAVKKREGETSGIQAKLLNIKLDKIEFEEATIAQVVAFLKKRSQDLDPDGEGVNIILQLEGKGVVGGGEISPEGKPLTEPGVPPVGAGGWGEAPPPGAPGAGGVPTVGPAPATSFPNAAGERTVTMSMNNIPLGEVIRYVCMGAGLKYRVEPSAVIIADKSFPLDDLETRFYSVEAGVFETVRTKTSGAGFRTGTGEEEPAEAVTDEKTSAQNLMQIFTDLGVDFPQGSKISYNARTSKLIVHNTPENLRKVEKILPEINITPTQVTIEAKFMEVNQTDLDALGFEWLLLNGDGNFNDGLVIGKDGNNKLQLLKQGGVSPFDSRLDNGLRGVSSALSNISASANDLLTVNSILGAAAFQTVIHALSQNTNSDMLSAPKVTTLSGNTAILRMVTERYFPTSWSEPTVTSGGTTTGSSYTPSIPEFGEARDIGVIMEVTPTVAGDGYTITLELKPRVEEFLGYDTALNYDMVINGEKIAAKAEMPIIEARTVETKVIIWDGETVVLGGLIKEQLQSYKDKIPLLGDIPLLGRLFTNTGEQSIKKNLLIFVTARLVNPAGVPIRTNDVRGLPDFRR